MENKIRSFIEFRAELVLRLRRLPGFQEPADFLPVGAQGESLLVMTEPNHELSIEDGKCWYRIKADDKLLSEYLVEDVDRLMTNVLDLFIFKMAIKYELENRIEGQDFRRLLFAYSDFLWSLIGKPYYSLAHIYYHNGIYNGKFEDELND